MPIEIVRTDLLRLDKAQAIHFLQWVNAIGVLFRELRPLED